MLVELTVSNNHKMLVSQQKTARLHNYIMVQL